MIVIVCVCLTISALFAGSCVGYGFAGRDRNKIATAVSSGAFFTLISWGLYHFAKTMDTDLGWLWIVMTCVGAAIGVKGRNL